MRFWFFTPVHRSDSPRRHATYVERVPEALAPGPGPGPTEVDVNVRYRIRTIAGDVFWLTEERMKTWIELWFSDPTLPDAFTVLRLPEGGFNG